MVDTNKPTLCYFNIKVKGEALRMLLHHAKVEVNEVRVAVPQWPTLKPKTSAGQLPIWIEPGHDECEEPITAGEISLPAGRHFNQANAILRRLGEKYGYMAEGLEDQWSVDWSLEHF